MSSDSQPVILVPVDFSEHSAAALSFAARLATRLNFDLLILHVVHDPAESPGYYALPEGATGSARLEEEAAKMLDEFVARTRAQNPDSIALANARKSLVVGLPVTRILQVVEKVAPVLVVMGSLGRTGLGRLILGSKAEQIVRLCPQPVTIVKAPREPPEPKPDRT